MIDTARLARKCSTWNICLTQRQLDQLDLYAQLLVAYTKKVNLTAILDPQGIEDRHFVDCLFLAAQPEMQGCVVDVGSGGGFPGVVAKIYKPELQLVLMEPTGKRLTFLQTLCAVLHLDGVEFVKERAEEAARKVWREQFSVATARAVAPMPILSEYCLPLIKPGGVFLAMKGPEAPTECAAAGAALKALGAGTPALRAYTLPDGSERRLVLCRKIRPTPKRYPRSGGVIAKRPL